MRFLRRPFIAGCAASLVLLLVLWSCSAADDETTPGLGDVPTTLTTDAPPPPFVPITGGTGEDGQPEPPPIHAVFSVVVRGATSWDPYSGPELTGLDHEAAAVIAGRLQRLDQVLRQANIPASIELAYGPARALCEVAPEVLVQLEENGHRIGLYARSSGEAFRTVNALAECGRVATTGSGLAAMADTPGPQPPTRASLADALAILSLLEIHQVVGALSPICQELGLAQPTHGYGTGAFTAPWRSAWTEGNTCVDLVTGQIVLIDQTLLSPTDGNLRIDSASISVLRTRSEQTLAHALDRRFAAPVDLPAPGVITWGVRVWLHELIPEQEPLDEPDPPDGHNGSDDSDVADDGDEVPPEGASVIDPRTAALSDATLDELSALFEEWQPSVDAGRLRWMLPDEVAAIIRPR